MRKIILAGLVALAVAGCATEPLPDNYSGPTATIGDTDTRRSEHSVDFFFVSEYNGKSVNNALIATRQANYGQGFAMSPMKWSRQVPTVESTFRIEGQTHYAAPILDVIHKIYHVSGELKFTPVEHHVYLVKGELNEEHSIVWIEDEDTHEVIGKKFEAKGSSTLGVLEK